MNITGQQASEDALRQSEAELKMVTDALPVLIGYVDAEERFRFNNRYYSDWFGHSTEWLLGKTAREVLGERGYAERQTSIRDALAGRDVTFEAHSPHRDGQPRRMLVHYLPRRDGQGNVLGFFVMALDVTERWRAEQALRELNETLESRIQERTQALAEVYERLLKEMASREQAQEALRQAQKMEAVGQLTGGIAHDFNNLLMVISGGLDMLDRRADPARRERLMDGMRQAAQRGTALTRQLLAFSRRQSLEPESVDLVLRIGRMRELLDRSLSGDVHVEVQFEPDLWPVEVDPGELELVVLNLAVNARDAMPDGGSILIEASNAPGETVLGITGDFVRLTVTDSGTGIPEEVRTRVFDPFFTTKEIGKGSGLGLAQVYGFARQSGGTVWIESECDRGTSVIMLLPRSARVPDQPDGERPVEDDSPDASAGTVLLVDDDEEVAALVGEMLEHLGYRVTHAASAIDALTALQNGCQVDIVFSDVMMPGGMNGVELAREIRTRDLGVPVLLTSGYAEAAQQSAAAEGVHVLAKPYRLEELAISLRTAIDGVEVH